MSKERSMIFRVDERDVAETVLWTVNQAHKRGNNDKKFDEEKDRFTRVTRRIDSIHPKEEDLLFTASLPPGGNSYSFFCNSLKLFLSATNDMLLQPELNSKWNFDKAVWVTSLHWRLIGTHGQHALRWIPINIEEQGSLPETFGKYPTPIYTGSPICWEYIFVW